MTRTSITLGSTLGSLALILMSQSAFAQSNKYPYLEAECPTNASGNYTVTTSSHAGFSGAGHLQSTGNTTASVYNGSSSDSATYDFAVFEKQVYTVYFRVNTNANYGDDSFYFQLAGYPWETINGVASQGTGWVWVEGPSYLLSEGAVSLQLANRESGLNIDKIALLKDSEPAPTGLGEAAFNCPVPLYFEAECRSEATAGYTARYTVKDGYSGLGYLQSRDNTYSPETGEDTVSYTFETSDSPYSLHFRVHTNGDWLDDSFYYRIDGGPWQTINGISSQGTGWIWTLGFTNRFLNRGSHTVDIANREDGLSLDKLALVPAGSPAPSGVGETGVNCYGDSDDWRGSDVYDYANGHVSYFIDEGAFLLNRHDEWHTRRRHVGNGNYIYYNGPGGTVGPGSGVAFLGFHRAVLNRFEQHALENYGIRWEALAIDAVLPYQLPNAYMALAAAGPEFEATFEEQQSRDLTQIGLPAYFTLDGTPDINGNNSIEFEGTTYTRLNDIENLDTLGRLIGHYYHSVVHDQIGGTMQSYYSPADPAFYLWHGRLDQLADLWLTTPSGRAWVAAHPGHPFLQAGYTDLEGWESDAWKLRVDEF